MFQTLLITFREGLEAFLIISISLIYLAQTNRRHLAPAIHAGVGLALLLSIALGVVLAHIGALSPSAEAVMALIAAASVIYCTMHMMRMGRFMKQEINSGLDKAAHHSAARAWWLAFLFAVFMVGREGVETATMLASLALQAGAQNLLTGGILGTLLAAALAWAWVRFGKQVKLQRFFQVTAIFMTLFAAQLLLHAFHEFTEAGAVPLLDNAWWHIATEPWGPEGEYGQWLSIALGVLPLLWLGYGWLADRKADAGRAHLKHS